MKKILLFGVIAMSIAASTSVAQATTVKFRVEGKTAELVPGQSVVLPTAPILKDGEHPCAPDSAGGALQKTVGDDWHTQYFEGLGYLVDGIKTESHVFPDPDYFTLWLNHKSSSTGMCAAGLQEGDDVLIFVDSCVSDPETFECTNDPVLPLALAAPTTVTPGVPFTVTVTRYSQAGVSAPVEGASVAGGSAAATTDAAGHASLTIAAGGPASLRATKTGFAGETVATCATAGADGFCGTTKPGDPPPPPCLATNGHDGKCGTKDTTPAWPLTAFLTDKQHFASGAGPRTLSGTITIDPSGIKDIRLSLSRNNNGACSRYDGLSTRFVKLSRCGAKYATQFSVGDRVNWSYLLPSKLGKGRYVLDIQVTDGAGNVTKVDKRGRDRFIFYVD